MLQPIFDEDSALAHAIVVPGCFIVLQGIPGDGLSNTIDTGPDVEYDARRPDPGTNNGVHYHHAGRDRDSDNPYSMPADGTGADEAVHTANADEGGRPPTPSKSAQTTAILTATLTSTAPRISPPLTTSETLAIQRWESSCRSREQRQRSDWLDLQNASEKDDLWWLHEGKLVVLRDPPTKTMHVVERDVIGTLAPGSTVVANELICLESTSLLPMGIPLAAQQHMAQQPLGVVPGLIHPRGRYGECQLLRIISPHPGYIVMSMDGYPFLAPGEWSSLTDLQVWMWRVTCSAGAFVREGLELTTKHVKTLPFGSFLNVSHKVVNAMGLPRLHVQAVMDDGHVVEGWISEFLNPLSGQRGPVAQPLPFPVPALYKVTLPEGAVVRSDVELSSPQIGHAAVGAILTIVGRAFSEHPQEMCIERLKLAGHGGGWVSVRLNKPPPLNEPVLEFVGMDGSFDPNAPGLWHLNQSPRVTEEDDDDDNPQQKQFKPPTSNSTKNTVQQRSVAPDRQKEDKCLICLTEVRNSTIVHGETGHIACCLVCARVLKARGDRCPVCRLPIDCIIQQFWA
jgi:hypothetical protein